MAPLTRICLIGPESTGKSHLAQKLAEHFNAPWIAEHARDHATARNNQLTYDDVEPIAKGQIAFIDNRQPPTGNLLILDTDLISTVVYSRHYYGRVPQWIEEEARRRKADLYLLMDTDVPWQPDEARDSGGEEREDLFDDFRRALDEFETRWTIVSGDWDERFRTVLEEVARLRGSAVPR